MFCHEGTRDNSVGARSQWWASGTGQGHFVAGRLDSLLLGTTKGLE